MQICRVVGSATRVGRHLLWDVCKTYNGRKEEKNIKRFYSTCPSGMKVTICGAAGCTGQPLALLLKQCPLLDEIALYDICATCGYGMELSHVDTKCKVSSYSGRHMLCDALKGAKVVVIVAKNQCDSFECSAPIVTEITLQICNTCPNAFTIVATEPVESMVPLVSEIQRLRGTYNPRALLGCVELNCVRANTALADFLRMPPESVRVPVIGGATPNTMVPVLSAAVHPCVMTQEQIECVTSSIMSGTEAVCAAKSCAETACLAGAYAVARNTINVVKGLQGAKNVIQCAYVDSLGYCAPECSMLVFEMFNADNEHIKALETIPTSINSPITEEDQYRLVGVVTFVPPAVKESSSGKQIGHYKAVCLRGTDWIEYDDMLRAGKIIKSKTLVVLGPSGVEKNLGIPELTKFENCLLCNCLPFVRNEIARAIWLVYSMCQQCCCTSCYVDPSTSYTPPVVPCVPPTHWTCDCPDDCRDEYLASICRDMTCACGTTELCWRPRDVDYDAARASNLTHQMPLKSPACSQCRVPRSVRIEQQLRERAKNPCYTT